MTTRRFPLRLWRRCHRLWLASLCLCALTASASPLRVLIFSGRNNHNWAATTPRLESILINSGRFVVTVTEHPDQCDAAMFKQFDAILSNWNNFGAKPGEGDWPPAMRQAFLDFVRSGGGLVIVHAGSSSFPDWAAYQGLVGGTWGKGTGRFIRLRAGCSRS
jgi:hypothetical protein